TWDGTSWTGLDLGHPVNLGKVTVFNGSLIAGGWWAGGVSGLPSGNYVAQWNGTGWQVLGGACPELMNPLAGCNNTHAGAGGVGRRSVQQWNGGTWTPMGTLGPATFALQVHNGTLFAGGVQSVDFWTGAAWQSITPGTTSGWIQSLGVYNGQLVAGGQFSL